MELLQLRYFLDCAELLSIAKTAKKYMVPPSSVSACIKRLEAEIGAELFERSANKIALNSSGIKLKNCLAEVMGKLDDTVESIKNPNCSDREIKILVRALRNVVTQKVIEYKKQNDKARFKMVSEFDIEDFENYDLVVDTKSDIYSGFERVELVSQPIKIFAAKDSEFAGKKLTLTMLKDQPFASMSQLGKQYKTLCEACQKVGFSPNLVAQINDYDCFIKIIEAGAAIGAAGQESINAAGSKSIVPLNVTDFKEAQTVCVYYRKENCIGNIKHFLNFLNSN